MAPHDPLDDDLDGEEAYHESSDEDFDPVAIPADESSASSDEEEANAKPAARKGKRKAPADDDLDSGDEVTIQAAARKRKSKKQKGGKKNVDDDELILSEDEGGDGGLIKTRAQRRDEQKERRPLARTDGATVDVDALWAQMSAAPLQPTHPPSVSKDQETQAQGANKDSEAQVQDETDLVSIKKVYNFAGQNTTEEKQVPRSLLDKHLADGWKTVETGAVGSDAEKKSEKDAESKIRRPLRRPSRFDANPLGYVRALPAEHQLGWPRRGRITPTAAPGQDNPNMAEATKAIRPERAQKLNVVDKSRLDWTGFVNKEGIAEELDVHGKTKEAYLGRMEFLAGVDARREEERRRMKTATTT
ncbi:BCNT-domain-containing protein [Aaosphaeria arxii CBS 175.79]|uniref:SWR1-complex protein 5 n=1 Tax=Aaosphaeria arxii CBS 175.79 TaxID=1450172 RepID=A0A6A5X7Q0_9PLEO|nr:BCNT-domain-containing protein [Aaosphaeria arxii CBS 175.79]KAF2008973.1 BCNT-domain-containing protein [Aaosphaeria arxii CBS 175.79]